MWAGLDLSSQTQGVGIFYKSYFYDYREDLVSRFSDLASRARDNSERIAQTFGFYETRAYRFADGVNPVGGKNWRNYVPGKIALDSEVVTLAGGKGVSFVSTDDGRPYVDTPLDTFDRVNFKNLRDQLVMIACITDNWFRDSSSSMDEEVLLGKVVNDDTVSVYEPLKVGYVLGVYADKECKGKNYFQPNNDKFKQDKYVPETIGEGKLKLTAKLPAGTEKVYIRNKFLTRDVFEWCNNVTYREISHVAVPADPTANSMGICYKDDKSGELICK